MAGPLLQVWDPNGKSDGLYVIGTTIYTCLLLTMQAKVALLAQYVVVFLRLRKHSFSGIS